MPEITPEEQADIIIQSLKEHPGQTPAFQTFTPDVEAALAAKGISRTSTGAGYYITGLPGFTPPPSRVNPSFGPSVNEAQARERQAQADTQARFESVYGKQFFEIANTPQGQPTTREEYLQATARGPKYEASLPIGLKSISINKTEQPQDNAIESQGSALRFVNIYKTEAGEKKEITNEYTITGEPTPQPKIQVTEPTVTESKVSFKYPTAYLTAESPRQFTDYLTIAGLEYETKTAIESAISLPINAYQNIINPQSQFSTRVREIREGGPAKAAQALATTLGEGVPIFVSGFAQQLQNIYNGEKGALGELAGQVAFFEIGGRVLKGFSTTTTIESPRLTYEDVAIKNIPIFKGVSIVAGRTATPLIGLTLEGLKILPRDISENTIAKIRSSGVKVIEPVTEVQTFFAEKIAEKTVKPQEQQLAQSIGKGATQSQYIASKYIDTSPINIARLGTKGNQILISSLEKEPNYVIYGSVSALKQSGSFFLREVKDIDIHVPNAAETSQRILQNLKDAGINARLKGTAIEVKLPKGDYEKAIEIKDASTIPEDTHFGEPLGKTPQGQPYLTFGFKEQSPIKIGKSLFNPLGEQQARLARSTMQIRIEEAVRKPEVQRVFKDYVRYISGQRALISSAKTSVFVEPIGNRILPTGLPQLNPFIALRGILAERQLGKTIDLLKTLRPEVYRAITKGTSETEVLAVKTTEPISLKSPSSLYYSVVGGTTKGRGSLGSFYQPTNSPKTYSFSAYSSSLKTNYPSIYGKSSFAKISSPYSPIQPQTTLRYSPKINPQKESTPYQITPINTSTKISPPQITTSSYGSTTKTSTTSSTRFYPTEKPSPPAYNSKPPNLPPYNPKNLLDTQKASTKRKRLLQSFLTQVRTKGQFLTVSGKPQTREEALALGVKTTKATLAATFRLIPTGRFIEEPKPTRNVTQTLKTEFTTLKNKAPLTYVQRLGTRLGTRTERTEIQRTKQATTKRNIFGF